MLIFRKRKKQTNRFITITTNSNTIHRFYNAAIKYEDNFCAIECGSKIFTFNYKQISNLKSELIK